MTNKSVICGDRLLIAGARTYVMGIVNVTPDSFSDGGCYVEPDYAIEHGIRLLEEGADILDVGGCATSPNAKLISEEEELKRVVPVIEGLRRRGISNIAIDTMRSSVARQALSAGASWINDQSAGLFDTEMPKLMSMADGVVLMHNGGGATSGVEAGELVVYPDVMRDVRDFFCGRVAALTACGVSQEKIIVDPGIGFGKGLLDSLHIINNMAPLRKLGVMSLIGVSRKSFLGKLSGIKIPKERDFASLGAAAAAIFSGADIIRTHNVRATVEMTSVLDSCLKS